jgi:predicted nucleic acid-binding protein
MNYLLDTNVLLAMGDVYHAHNERVLRWMNPLLRATRDAPVFITCSITEIGFVRIASGRAGWCPDVESAKTNLRRLKVGRPFTFVSDGLDGQSLPSWATRSNQVTDGHLLELAQSHGARLATLDEGIPGALLIPHLGDDGFEVREPLLAYGTAAA